MQTTTTTKKSYRIGINVITRMNEISVRSFRIWHYTIYTGWLDGRNQANNMENDWMKAQDRYPPHRLLCSSLYHWFSPFLRFPFLSAHFQFFLVLVKQLGNVEFPKTASKWNILTQTQFVRPFLKHFTWIIPVSSGLCVCVCANEKGSLSAKYTLQHIQIQINKQSLAKHIGSFID